uniref:FYVE-type domain-containing protein n=1 Tax=Paramoeba aestuarina TaxID=180227 RepID=A0A7S4PNV2_9EUKA|mmetsp:Transcript_9844/g.14898  ORF Transcript_9844/g.14898 Transcript_9844/m.14898 type:complete len:201 (+) Transcript_9844:89-691(+)|eukprot:CAMPEP_0201528820 /NCGR_PEP_ID=MMETSP0161_2-20130828/39649_1 /ASSEMBLY_ACC=CAM_ASM_000251 /TAXON_ID=180227 /ORGANISM="Neoparamoeba aestuarina, Strain SoJaBio B1-5/56/2" /LENGTH=200 /DNA_ID=CAMNT_0047930299 /DNA_START=79 /DNA_END=681 /DNA_ORIENTATION=+
MTDKRQRDVQNLQTRGLKWVPDPEENNCSKCAAEFGFVTRRHHCRVCGHIFCDNCCKNYNSFPETLHHHDRVRVCSDCYMRGGKPPDQTPQVTVKTYTVVGYTNCANHQKVADILAVLVGKYPTLLRGEIVGADTKEEYEAWLVEKTAKIGIQHTTSPICFLGTEDDGDYLGGADDFIAYLSERFPYDVSNKKDGGCHVM